ncbi:MAG: hypothetical protein KA258_03575 [Deltaproteobacteria bacterium]|nr:hypothetical protein [Deltaproteobacteria bacterium]
MAKDESDDIEWRLVATKGRESCRWQTTDGRWIALALGAQGDLTKVLVNASDGRSEVVDGYEQGLNLARRWRAGWLRTHGPTASSQSGSWLPHLPGRPSGPEDVSSPDLPPLRNQTIGSPTTRSRPSYPSVPSTGQSPPAQSSPPASGSFPSRSSLNNNRVSPVSRGSSPASSSGNVPAVPGSANSPASRDSRRRMSGSLPAIRLGDGERPVGDGDPRPSSSSNPKR